MKRGSAPAIWAIIPLIWLFFFLALNSMVGDSPTMDEQNHLARGLAFVRTGDPRLSLEHPPLVNTLSALPLLTLPEVRLPIDHPSWQRQPPEVYWYFFADLLLWEYNQDVSRMVFLARLPVLFLTLALAMIGYHWARVVWGRPSALFAFFFLLFDPNILAHGRYITTDLGGAVFLFLAAFALWRLWRAPGWPRRRWLATAVTLGLAFGSKLSMLAFAPIFGVMALLPLYRGNAWPDAWPDAARRLWQLASAGLLSTAVVWAIFGFEWGALALQSPQLAVLNSLSGPMPTFWRGIEQILFLSSGGRPAFLLGQFSDHGFAAYFPIAFLVKTPPALLLLLVLALPLLLAQKDTRRSALFLLIPALLYFLFTIQSGLNIGYRHLLPMLPFLYVLVSGLFQVPGSRFQVPGFRFQVSGSRFHVSRIALIAGALSLLISTLAIHPHYLSYFNVAAGGPENGRNILIDSNIDWGQDLLRLGQWMEGNGVEEVKLGWFGTARPAYYGIRYQPLPGLGGVGQPQFFDAWWDVPFDPAAPAPGVYAISATSLWEFPLDEKTVYAWFRARQPDDQIGYSILIYRVP